MKKEVRYDFNYFKMFPSSSIRSFGSDLSRFQEEEKDFLFSKPVNSCMHNSIQVVW
jgi:hypothetical protein